jgi:hypothetical protein
VRLSAEAVNLRPVPVQGDLWSNTRLDGRCHSYVFNQGGNVRIDSAFNPDRQEMLPYEITRGFFGFKVPASLHGLTAAAKAYLAPGSDTICAFGKDFLFIKSFTLTPNALVSKSQAPVEIYQLVSGDASAGVLELEFHGAYHKLAPGESMAISETWRLLPYPGADTTVAHLEFLSTIGAPRSSGAGTPR